MTLFATPADFARLATGGPSVVAFDPVPPGLAMPVWRAVAVTGGFALLGPGAEAAAATMTLPAAPAGVIAILGDDPAIQAAWGPLPPPLVDLAGLPGIAFAALAARVVEAAELRTALVAARTEAEAPRLAMAAALAGTGREASPAPPALALTLDPDGGAIALGPEVALAQAPGVALDGLATLGLHLATAACGPDAALSVRLHGAESRHVAGAWIVRGDALRPGWLRLELPAALGPWRETLVLELRAGLGARDRLAVSLAAATMPAAAALQAEGAAVPSGRGLALRLWTAPFGRRFVAAAHWDAEAAGRPIPPPGVPVVLPEALWDTALLPGGGRAVAIGGVARPLLRLAGGQATLVTLPAVPLAGLDRIEARLTLALGDASAIAAALWLQPPWVTPRDIAQLGFAAAPARWSGWRPGRGGAAGLALPLALPPPGVALGAVVLALRAVGGADALVEVEWSELVGFRDAVALPPAPAGSARRVAAAAALVPGGARPGLDRVRLQELWVSADGGYQHLDIRVEGLRFGALFWPALRFKLAIGGEAPQLEFRQRVDWPTVFVAWPGVVVDEHGPVLAVAEGELAALQARLEADQDRHLLTALLRLLPTIVATAAREAVPDLVAFEAWMDLSRRLAAKDEKKEGV